MAPTSPTFNPRITSLDFEINRNRRRRRRSSGSELRPGDDGYDFMAQVAQGIIEQDRVKMRREVTRVMSFVCAVLSWYVRTCRLLD